MSLRVALWAVLALLVALVSPAWAAYTCMTVPNQPTAFFEQANLYSQDLQIITEAIMQTGVVGEASECLVQAQASPNMTTRITTGCTIAQHGATATVTTGSMTHSAAHSTLKRIDIVSANNVGTKIVTQGTPAASPEPPTIPQSGGFNNVVLATVYIPAGDTAIASNQIIDKRACIPTPGGGGGGAPTGAQYITSASDVGLSAERVATDTASITWDFGTAAQAKANVAAIPSTTPMLGSALATAIAAPGTPAAGKASVYVDSTTKTLCAKNDAGTVTCTGGSGAPSTATYITQTADAGLSAEQALSSLGTGYMKVTTGTGAITSQAVAIPRADGGTGQTTSPDDNILVGDGTVWALKALPNCPTGGIGYTLATNTFGCNTFGGSTPTGTGFPHITAGVQDGAAKLVDTADINAAQVTYAKIQDVSAASKLLGRGSAGGAGVPEEITLGTNLSMSGTTLNATGGGGGATLTTFATARPADSTGSLAMSSLTTRNVSLFELPGSIVVNQLSIYFTAVNTAGTLRLCLYSEDGATKLVDITITPAIGVISGAVGAVALTPGRYYVALGCATTCNVTAAAAPAPTVSTLFGANSPAGKQKWIGTVTHTSGTCNATRGTITGTNTAQPVLRGDN